MRNLLEIGGQWYKVVIRDDHGHITASNADGADGEEIFRGTAQLTMRNVCRLFSGEPLLNTTGQLLDAPAESRCVELPPDNPPPPNEPSPTADSEPPKAVTYTAYIHGSRRATYLHRQKLRVAGYHFVRDRGPGGWYARHRLTADQLATQRQFAASLDLQYTDDSKGRG